MMRKFLWWCIWLLVVGSTPLVVGGQWSVVGTSAFATRQSNGARRPPQVYQELQTGHRPPALCRRFPRLPPTTWRFGRQEQS